MVLLENEGDGTFSDATERAGVDYLTGEAVGWGTAFFDYDNDGWLDLYLAATGISPIPGKSGMNYAYPDMLYHNQGNGAFAPIDQNYLKNRAPDHGLQHGRLRPRRARGLRPDMVE